MKNLRKSMSVVLILLVSLFCLSTVAFASTSEQDGLKVELTTDKENYSLNEDIKINVTVTNTNDITVENVKIDTLLPEEFTLKDRNKSTSSEAVDIPAGEKIEFSVVAVVKDGKTSSNTDSSLTKKPDNNDSKVQAVQATDNKSDTNKKDTANKINGNDKSPYTGKDYAVMTGFSALFIIGIVLLILCLKRNRKKTSKAVSSALCLVLAVTSIFGLADFKAKAENKQLNTDTSSVISISDNISVNGKDYTIEANVSYQNNRLNLRDNLSGYLYSSQNSCNVGEKTDVIFYFQVYSGKVDKNTEINLYIDNVLIGNLNNNGINGDITKGDNIYSGTFSMFSDKRKVVKCHINYKDKETLESNNHLFYFYKPRTNSEQKTIDHFYLDIANIKDKYIMNSDEYNNENLALSKAEACYNEIMQYLDSRSDIEYYGFSGCNIMVDFKFGITVGIPFEDLIKDTTDNKMSLRSINAQNSINNVSSYKSKIATLQPCYTNLKTSVFDDAAIEIAKNSNYTFSKNLDNEQITVETMKSLSKYGIVIIDSHGGNWSNCGYIISLSEKATKEKHKKYTESGDLDNTIIDNGGFYIITQSFFEKYYSEDDLKNTLIYLGTCYGGDDNVEIRNILTRKGSEAILTYKNSVVATYNRKMITTIAERLSKGDTIQESVKKAKQKHGDHDPYLSSDTYNNLGFWNKLWYNLRLIESSSPAELILSGNNLSFKLVTDPISEQITGQILDSNNNSPISNVKISCSELNISCITDTNGKFSFNINLPLSQQTFIFEHENYQSKKITINSGNYMVLDTVQLAPKNGTICGRVKEQETNLPISNLEVRIYNENYTPGNEMYTQIDKTKTDSDGNFNFSLPSGEYILQVGGEGDIVNDYGYWQLECPITIVAGVPTVLLNDILLNRIENGITGYVYDNDDFINNAKDTPISDVLIEVYKDNNLIGKTTTDKNGKYSISVDKNGSYDLLFKKSGYNDEKKPFTDVNGGFANVNAHLQSKKTIVNGTPITKMKTIDYGQYTGNLGDSCMFNLDRKGLPGRDNRYYGNGNIGIDGTVYENGLEGWVARWNFKPEISWAYITYDIGGLYKQFSGNTNLIKSYSSSFNTTLYIYGDDKLLYSQVLTNERYDYSFNINVSNIRNLKIMLKDNVAVKSGTSFAIYDMFLN